MKHNDKHMLQIFADSSMLIDNKFKSKLKQRIVQYDTKLDGNRKAKNKRYAWPKFVLAPAMLFAIVAIGSVLLLNGGNPRQPFTAQKVSAAEVIELSKKYYASLDVRRYNFYVFKDTAIQGPKYNCSPTQGLGLTSGTYVLYNYWSKQDKTEASYTREDSKEYGTRQSSYFTRDGHVLHDTYADNVDREIWLYGLKYGGEPAYIFVDKDGREVSRDNMTTIKQDDREVYVIYARFNEQVNSGFCEDEIMAFVFDAKTFQALKSERYQHTIHPENLILKYERSESYDTVTESQALRTMAEAGFNQQTAAQELRPIGD